MPKGFHPHPTIDGIWKSIREHKEHVNFYGNGKSWCGGKNYLPDDETLFRTFWELQLTNHNGGLRIESIEVKNQEDAKIKISEITKLPGFVRMCGGIK